MTKSDVQDGRDMPRGGRPNEAVADIAARRDALRQAASLPGADLRALIDASLTELDAAIEAGGLGGANRRRAPRTGGRDRAGRRGPARGGRRPRGAVR